MNPLEHNSMVLKAIIVLLRAGFDDNELVYIFKGVEQFDKKAFGFQLQHIKRKMLMEKA